MIEGLFNRLELRVELRPVGSLHLGSVLPDPDPRRAEHSFVRTQHPELGATVFLPGTTLKGALRNRGERHGWGARPPAPKEEEEGRSQKRRRGRRSVDPKTLSPLERLFGTRGFAGRLRVDDALPLEPGAGAEAQKAAFGAANRTERRWRNPQDLARGLPVPGAEVEFEVVVAGSFHTTLVLENVELREIAMVAELLGELGQGRIRLGSQTGLATGQVQMVLKGGVWESAPSEAAGICGLGALVGPEQRERLGLAEELPHPLPANAAVAQTWRGDRVELEGAILGNLLADLAGAHLASMRPTKGAR